MNADVRGGKFLLLNKFVVEEDLSSQINGIQIVFTFSSSYISGTIRLYLNGLRQQNGPGKDYVESSTNQITFFTAPEVGDIILVDYIKQ